MQAMAEVHYLISGCDGTDMDCWSLLLRQQSSPIRIHIHNIHGLSGESAQKNCNV